MENWGELTERGTYTLTEKHKNKLRDVANRAQTLESKIVRKALDLYFERLKSKRDLKPEVRD